MATAVMEAIERGPSTWRHLDVRVLPGISAMQAAAARVGAPLGHDFCVISHSDRLKPWSIIAQRLEAAASADFVLALYNPLSSQRRRQLADAGAILRRHRAPETPVVLARDVGGSDERVLVTDLAHLDAVGADMRTIVLVGASTTRSFAGSDGRTFVYTPRAYGTREGATPMNTESSP
jgi:precorrin-3B C17-methyltransferase